MIVGYCSACSVDGSGLSITQTASANQNVTYNYLVNKLWTLCLANKLKSKPHDVFDDVILSRGWNCSMWHVLSLFIHGPEACCRILQRILLCWWNREWKACGTDCRVIRADCQTKWWTLWFKLLCCSFISLCHAPSKHCDSSREFTLTLRAWIHHHTGHHFIYPGWRKDKIDGLFNDMA